MGGPRCADYLIKAEGLPFRQAVEAVANNPAAVPISAERPIDKQLILPEKGGMLQARLIDYLCNRRASAAGL
jgi:hypothetical protein